MSHYLNELNPQQRDAVVYCGGPQLVIAGAGSGKTRVLTYKIAHLLDLGYEPWRIMALTFTNKAAREMKERIARVAGEQVASQLWMGTFHSIFLRILRRHADLLGYKSNFTIYDTSDSRSLLKTIIKDLELDDKVYKPATIASIISNAKNALVTPERYAADKKAMEADRRANRPLTARIYQLYAARCRLSGAMDFDDILLNMNILLRDNPDVTANYQEFFRYILVDEYQDTNFAQHLIVSRLSERHRSLCVVGDDAQSIYSFRGANISNILSLENSYPDLQVFKLERNYRSTQNIVNAAGSLIAKNRHQISKNVFSENAVGAPVEIVPAFSDYEEGYLLAAMVNRMRLTAHDSYDDYAVLYRTNAQSRILEEALRRRDIPYRIYGGLSFYQRKEVKDAICYLRLALNPDDDEALVRVINYPARGIGQTTVAKLRHAAVDSNASIWAVLRNPEEYKVAVNAGMKAKLKSFAELIDASIRDVAEGLDAYTVGRKMYVRTGILSVLDHDNTPESVSRKENLQELLKGMHSFVEDRREAGEDDLSLQAFLSEVSLATDQDEQDTSEGERVTLMTAHAAKGLEFKHVFIVGVEEDLFPSAMASGSLSEIEEERRLLYVAVTRAMETCTITYSKSRFRNGQTVSTRPSRFLSDFDTRFIRAKIDTDDGRDAGEHRGFERRVDPMSNYRRNEENTARPAGAAYGRRPASGASAIRPATPLRPLREAAASAPTPGPGVAAADLKSGDRVRHSKFGQGTVVEVMTQNGNELAIVDFDTFGRKKLLLRFARLEKL